mgnify:CR=1 FL=1
MSCVGEKIKFWSLLQIQSSQVQRNASWTLDRVVAARLLLSKGSCLGAEGTRVEVGLPQFAANGVMGEKLAGSLRSEI